MGASISYSSRERDTRDNSRFEPRRDAYNRDDDRRSSPFRQQSEPRRDVFNRDEDRRPSPFRQQNEPRRDVFNRDTGPGPRRQQTTETVRHLSRLLSYNSGLKFNMLWISSQTGRSRNNLQERANEAF